MKKLGIKFLGFVLISTIIFSFIQVFFVKSEVNAAISSSYTQYIKSGIGNFPDSYQKKLAYLKYLHPNWEFKAYYTGIDWNELTSTEAENRCMVNTIHKGNILDPAVLCKCGTMGDYGYYCASRLAVNYYLDPRNFMSETMVFQFLDLASTEGVSREVVARTVAGTYLEPYANDIFDAAMESGISPLHIVATIYQELGREKPSRIISGTVPGYEGLYNFYNYGATDGEGNIERGLEKAREYGWTTPRFAIIDGAKRVLASNYIAAGQTTKYFYKFDVVPNEILKESDGIKSFRSDNFYNHQYMTNLRDPSSQAGSLYKIYNENRVLDQKLTFVIPVYNNMPAEPAPVPTSLQGNEAYALFFVDTMYEGGVVLREGPGSWFNSLGTLYRGSIVLHIGVEGNYGKVKILAATNFNWETRQWNYEEKIGYVTNEYLTKLGSVEIPDYRDQVDMGTGGNVPVVPTGEGEFKFVENDSIAVMTPEVSVNTIKSKHGNAVIKVDGNVIADGKKLIPTGARIELDGKTYTAVKLGDVSLDGNLDSMDMYQIVQYLLENMTFDDMKFKAGDIDGNEVIDSMDMYKIVQYLLGNEKFKI